MPDTTVRPTRRRYDLAVFDFDGTLADTRDLFEEALCEAADLHGFARVDPADREYLRGRTALEIARHLRVPLWKFPRVSGFVRSKMAREIERVRMFEGIDEVLRALASSGVELALVSSNSEQNVLSVLGRSVDLFRERACGVSLFGKAIRLRRLLRRCGLDASRAILVGDELRDAQAARSAGMAFGAVAWGFNRPDVLRAQRPEEWFEAVRDLHTLMS